MAVEQKGPGGVNASYGRRVTGGSKYDLNKKYGDIVSEQGDPDPGVGMTFNPITGAVSPSATAAIQGATGLTPNPDGSIPLQIIPRTGTLTSLLGLAGGAGELASATNQPAIVQFNGSVGQAGVYVPNGRKDVVITGTGTVTAPILRPDAGIIWVTKDAAVTTINGFGRLSDGFFEGQTVEVVNKTGGARTSYYTGSHNDNQSVTFRWLEGAWKSVSSKLLTAASGLGSMSNANGTSSGQFSVALGGTASGLNSISLGSGTASGSSAVAISSGTASGDNSIAIRGTAVAPLSVSLGGRAVHRNQFAITRVTNVGASVAGIASQYSRCVLAGRTTDSATATLLSLAGDVVGDFTDVLEGTSWRGLRRFKITVLGHRPGQLAAFVAERTGVWYSTGTVAQLIGSVVTVGTDVNTGFASTPTVTIAVDPTYYYLGVTVNGATGQEVLWNAVVELQEIIL